MVSIQTLKYQHLLGTAWMIDTTAAGPPWPVLIFNTDTQAWENLGAHDSGGSSLLVVTPTPWHFVDDSSVDNGQPVDFVTLASGDVIAVGGM